MSQRQWIVILGVWIMVLPFLGFPYSWKQALYVLTGLGVIVFAYRIKFKEIAPKAETFVDSTPTASEPSAPSSYQNPPVTPDVR